MPAGMSGRVDDLDTAGTTQWITSFDMPDTNSRATIRQDETASGFQ